MSKPRFTVEPCQHGAIGVGDYAIRYTPPSVKNEDGSTTYGLSFQALLAGDALGEQEAVLQEVADILNKSSIGRRDPSE